MIPSSIPVAPTCSIPPVQAQCPRKDISEATAVGWKFEAGIDAGHRTEKGSERSIGYPEIVV